MIDSLRRLADDDPIRFLPCGDRLREIRDGVVPLGAGGAEVSLLRVAGFASSGMCDEQGMRSQPWRHGGISLRALTSGAVKGSVLVQ